MYSYHVCKEFAETNKVLRCKNSGLKKKSGVRRMESSLSAATTVFRSSVLGDREPLRAVEQDKHGPDMA